jgi:hypothetical protein
MANQPTRPSSPISLHSLKSILKARPSVGIPVKNTLSIYTPYQEKCLRHLAGLAWQVKEHDLGRFIQIYKHEFHGKQYSVSTDQLYSHLKDNPTFLTLEYTSQVNLWFWLLHHGIKTNAPNQ